MAHKQLSLGLSLPTSWAREDFLVADGNADALMIPEPQPVAGGGGEVARRQGEASAVVFAAPVAHAEPIGQRLRRRAAGDAFDEGETGWDRRGDAGGGDHRVVADVAAVAHPGGARIGRL